MKIANSAPTEHVDDIHTTLANPHCRTVMAHFAEAAEDVASIEDLSTAVSETGAADAADAAIALHHAALPKLDAAGVVDYDARSKTVRYYGHAALVDDTTGSTECESNAR